MSGTTAVTARESLDIRFLRRTRMPHSSIATLNCADLGTYTRGAHDGSAIITPAGGFTFQLTYFIMSL